MAIRVASSESGKFTRHHHTGLTISTEGGNQSLMEALLRAENKGAAATFMPTGETTTDGQHILNSALFESIFTDDVRQLGPAIAAANHTLLANGSDDYEQVSETFLLFGDPAMALKIPLPSRPKGLRAVRKLNGSVVLTWLTALECNGNPTAGYNIYRSTRPGRDYVKLNTTPLSDTEFVDDSFSIGNARAVVTIDDTTYYYAITAVDADGDESPLSLELSPTPEEAGNENKGILNVEIMNWIHSIYPLW